jgi:hypothetical protein
LSYAAILFLQIPQTKRKFIEAAINYVKKHPTATPMVVGLRVKVRLLVVVAVVMTIAFYYHCLFVNFNLYILAYTS